MRINVIFVVVDDAIMLLENIIRHYRMGKPSYKAASDGSKEDLGTILDVCNTMNGKTVCVFAPAVKDIISSIIKKFPQEFDAYLKN